VLHDPSQALFPLCSRETRDSIRKSRIHAEAALALKPFAGKFATLVRHRTWYRVAALATTTKNAITSATAQP